MTGWALVTGAAQRIGRAIALDLAEHGWDIVVHYHNSKQEAQQLAEEIQNLGRATCLAEIDLSNAKHTEALIPSLAEEIGMIDALVNNAALFEPDENDPDGSRHWAINADAPRLLSKAFRDHLPKNERGVIVNLLDASLLVDPTGSAIRVTADDTLKPAPKFTSYARSKAFLADMTRNMAKAYAPQVRVNGVAPMYVLPGPRQSEESFRKMAGDKIVSPENVAEAVRKLIETKDETGQIVLLD